MDDPAYADLRQFMEEIGASDPAIEQLAGVAQVPLTPEFINPFGLSGEVAQPEYLSPRLTVTAELHLPNIGDLAAVGGPLAAGPGVLGEVFYGQGMTAPVGDEWYLYAKTFTAPCSPTGIREYGVVAFDTTPPSGGVAERYASATSNLFYGGNVAYVLHADPQNPFSALRYEMAPSGAVPAFTTTNSNWMAICGGDTVIGLIPASEWDGISDLRFFGYDVPIANDGQAQSGDASQMRVPGVAEDPQQVIDIPVIEVGAPSFTPGPTLPPSDLPTVQPTAAPSTDSIPTSQPTASAIAAATSPLPALSPAIAVMPSPSVVPISPPTVPTVPTAGTGIDPLILIFLLGLALIGLSILLFLLSRRDSDCDELAKLAQAAQQECDGARAAAAGARARQQKAARDLDSVRQHEAAARVKLGDAQHALDAAKGRAGGTSDASELQNEANAKARADADAEKAAARQAWKDAGGRQGSSAARLDGQLADIERAVQDKVARNIDLRNLGELRAAAAGTAKAQLGTLESELAVARASLDEAAVAMSSATQTEAAARAEVSAAEEHATEVCGRAADARWQYEECLKKTSMGGAALSNPPARPCNDGDESWEPEGEAQLFVVRADGPRTRVTLWTDPGIKAMEKWIKGSPSAAGRGDNEHHPSITSPEIDLISNQRLGQWVAGLSKAGDAPNIEIGFEIECVSRSIQCQRRWVCQGGRWVETPDRRADIQIVDRSQRSLNETDVTPSTNAMRMFLNKAKTMVDELKQAEAEAEKAARCA